MENQFSVPTRERVTPENQVIFDKINDSLGFVPNLYATFAYSNTALETYLQLQNAGTSLSKKEKEIINLVVSQVNECRYCQSAHTVLGKMNGLSEEQMIEVRKGTAVFDAKTDALVKIAKEIALQRGKVSESTLNNFFAAGYTKTSLVDLVIAIGDKVIMNYLHNITEVPIDFPLASEL